MLPALATKPRVTITVLPAATRINPPAGLVIPLAAKSSSPPVRAYRHINANNNVGDLKPMAETHRLWRGLSTILSASYELAAENSNSSSKS